MWGVLLILGILFRIMHWPFSPIIIIISSGGLHAYCISGFVRPKVRNTLSTAISIIGVIWLVVLIDGSLYNQRGLIIYVMTFYIPL